MSVFDCKQRKQSASSVFWLSRNRDSIASHRLRCSLTSTDATAPAIVLIAARPECHRARADEFRNRSARPDRQANTRRPYVIALAASASVWEIAKTTLSVTVRALFQGGRTAHAEHWKATARRNRETCTQDKSRRDASGEESNRPAPSRHRVAEASGGRAPAPSRAPLAQGGCNAPDVGGTFAEKEYPLRREGLARTAQTPRAFCGGFWKARGRESAVDLQLGAGTGASARRADFEIGRASGNGQTRGSSQIEPTGRGEGQEAAQAVTIPRAVRWTDKRVVRKTCVHPHGSGVRWWRRDSHPTGS